MAKEIGGQVNDNTLRGEAEFMKCSVAVSLAALMLCGCKAPDYQFHSNVTVKEGFYKDCTGVIEDYSEDVNPVTLLKQTTITYSVMLRCDGLPMGFKQFTENILEKK